MFGPNGHLKECWLQINSVMTRVIQLGLKTAIGDKHSMVDEKTIVLLISGNPGEVGYYCDLMSDIHKQTALPVIGLSHGGHNLLPKGQSNPSVAQNGDLYSLNGQIVHKMAFIEKYISIESKMILIGHSIGCYIILELLNRYPNVCSKVLHSILIFPTIESMGETSEAIKYKFLFEWFKYPLLGLCYVFNQLSDYYKQKLVSFVLKDQQLSDCAVRSATNLLNPNCFQALIHMSLIEFQTVNQLNREAIDENESNLTFFYGKADKWCPIEYYQRIHELYPNCDISLCLGDINHAFVLNKESTERVSQMVVNKIHSIVTNL